MAASSFDLADRTYTFFSALGFRICLSTVSHPFDYAKFLMQIGHEPMPSYPSRTVFGKPTRALPNIFKYVGYIRNTDGILGCFRGYVPKITGQIISTFAAENVTKRMKIDGDFNPSEDEISNEQRWVHFKQTLMKDFVGKSVTIVVSQPFYVISSRSMAQFVGGEEIYSGFFGSIAEVYRNEGIRGFFIGLVPRWLGEIITLLLSSFVIYGINNYLIHDPEIKSLSSASIQFICHTLTYPFTVVSACYTVNNCGLAAGQPPQMPIFDNWTHTWRYLQQINQLNRGSNTLFRYCPPTRQSGSLDAKMLDTLK
ncbi:unnamed protein product [Nezara viridula]|uniref:Uncharacterized protein n=1 Tax=Nezara viridula TaxID=85310 RepID=A0A9P0EB79_NEZVI|nr:unnamed protein product [Nezara viridula]